MVKLTQGVHVTSAHVKWSQHKNDTIYTPIKEPQVLEKPEIVEAVRTLTRYSYPGYTIHVLVL